MRRHQSLPEGCYLTCLHIIYRKNEKITTKILPTTSIYQQTGQSDHWSAGPEHVHACCVSITDGSVKTDVGQLTTTYVLLLPDTHTHTHTMLLSVNYSIHM